MKKQKLKPWSVTAHVWKKREMVGSPTFNVMATNHIEARKVAMEKVMILFGDPGEVTVDLRVHSDDKMDAEAWLDLYEEHEVWYL